MPNLGQQPLSVSDRINIAFGVLTVVTSIVAIVIGAVTLRIHKRSIARSKAYPLYC